MANYPDAKQYQEIAEKLNKKFNIKDETEKTQLREALSNADYQVDLNDETYNIYMNRLFALMHNMRDEGKPSAKALKL